MPHYEYNDEEAELLNLEDSILDESEDADFDEDMDEDELYDDCLHMMYPNADQDEIEEELESRIRDF